MLVALSRFIKWRRLLTSVKPDTLIRWHRKGFRLFWHWKSRAPGRPPIPADLRQEYTFEDSVNGAGDGAIALLIVPLTGAALGALRGHLRYPPTATRPEGLPERA